ncbi:hypothetical protein AAMO2058_000178900 [Amorphochlora amoebiformis]
MNVIGFEIWKKNQQARREEEKGLLCRRIIEHPCTACTLRDTLPNGVGGRLGRGLGTEAAYTRCSPQLMNLMTFMTEEFRRS